MLIRKSYRVPQDSRLVSELSQELFYQDPIQYLAKHGLFINYDINPIQHTYEYEIVFEFDLPEKHVTFYNIKYGNK